jgi:S-adenosylmethionine:tRNA ribosyltransferase-isomerase
MNMFLDYHLPVERIAQRPVEPRDAARLLVAERRSGAMRHRHVRDLPELLRGGDLLVVNDTKVLTARLLGRRAKTGGKWEGLYLGTTAEGEWELLCQTRGTLTAGELVEVEPGPLALELTARPAGQPWRFRPHSAEPAVELLQRHGHVPLPPYIRKGIADEADRGRYQTVFAQPPGSVAAPTAGLHFTPELLDRLAAAGIGRVAVTLHVGLGTFQPLGDGDPARHVMHREWCTVSPAAVATIQSAKADGGRVVAVGTTTVRTLESAARGGALQPFTGETDLYIHEPFAFRVVDALMTNFHLPRTSLLLLVGAFAGEALTRRAYEAAVAGAYRFFSYGDAMLVL